MSKDKSSSLKTLKERLDSSKNDDDDDDYGSEAYTLYKKETKQTEYEVYLGTTIISVTEYHELFRKMSEASERDSFKIILNNYGGYVATGTQFINAIRSTKAKVTTVVAGPVYSMASLIALAVPDVVVSPHTFLMLHDYSGMEMGKGSEMVKSIECYKPYFDELLKDTCGWFLTKKEVSNICSGIDVYIGSVDAIDRLTRRKK